MVACVDYSSERVEAAVEGCHERVELVEVGCPGADVVWDHAALGAACYLRQMI